MSFISDFVVDFYGVPVFDASTGANDDFSQKKSWATHDSPIGLAVSSFYILREVTPYNFKGSYPPAEQYRSWDERPRVRQVSTATGWSTSSRCAR